MITNNHLQAIYSSARSNPKEVLMHCLSEEGDELGWYKPALIDHAASMILGSPEVALKVTSEALEGLIKDGLVVAGSKQLDLVALSSMK